jgi:hypothetical protein
MGGAPISRGSSEPLLDHILAMVHNQHLCQITELWRHRNNLISAMLASSSSSCRAPPLILATRLSSPPYPS